MESIAKTLNDDLVNVAKSIHVLEHISWPMNIQKQFLKDWKQGCPRLPKMEYGTVDFSESISQLERIATSASKLDNPVGSYLAETAISYSSIANLLMQTGTPRAGDLAVEIYGKPGSAIPGSKQTNLDAARYFTKVSRDYVLDQNERVSPYVLSAESVASEMQQRIGEVITEDKITVKLDTKLASKAAAGATRIRLREGTYFSRNDVEQLLQHEAFVHSLTALNGRKQPNLTALSLGAPRTTAAQEGLATFAELVTGSVDIARMARLAQRVEAIDRALSGADFIEVFRSLIECGLDEVESFNSTMRVFRGVPVTGGYAFTKDVVYMTGLLEVHTFFRWALLNKKMSLCDLLFAGRMKLTDALLLEEAYSTGEISKPYYLPAWMKDTTSLTAYLAFAIFSDEIIVAGVDSDAFNI
ncbi:MAG: hypothetical protein ACJAVI_003724 [Candidatus Azotimanducaceae bacterium]|jgi:uncharacterized protein (TIGR02421 family)